MSNSEKNFNKNKRKIIVIGPLPPPFHGQSVSFKMFVDELSSKNIDSKVINLASRVSLNRKLYILVRTIEYIQLFIEYFRLLYKDYRIIYLTIAQSRSGFLRDLVFIWLAALFNCRIIVHLKGGNYGGFYHQQNKIFRYVIRRTLIKTDKILVLGKNLFSMFDFMPELQNRIKIVHNGLPFSSSSLDTYDDGYFSRGCLRVLFLSNMIEKKGYFEVLEAIKIVKQLGVEVHCDFCGEFLISSDDEIIRNQKHAKSLFFSRVHEYNLSGHVDYHGTVDGESKFAQLRSSHVFVLPTNYINEGQPVSIIEAMAFGNVVISTDYRAITDLIVHEETGFLLKSRSSQDIASYLLRLANDRILLKNMSEAAVCRVKERFTRDIHLTNLLSEIYE